MPPSEPTLAPDLVWGLSNIAAYIGRTRRQVETAIKKGDLPARQVSGRWVASKTAIRARLGLDRGAA
jgi:hypothetical protein